MTNREALIELLEKKEFESDILATSFIECPYTSDKDCKNPHPYGTSDYQIFCDEDCKCEWLEKEIDV